MLTDLIDCGPLFGNGIQELVDQIFDFVGDIMLEYKLVLHNFLLALERNFTTDHIIK